MAAKVITAKVQMTMSAQYTVVCLLLRRPSRINRFNAFVYSNNEAGNHYDINKSKGGFDRIHDLSFGGRSRVMQSYTVMKNIMAMTASWSISDSSWGYTRIKKRQMIPRTVILRMLQSRALSGRFCRLQRFRMTVENARMTIRMVM